jgi:hypothetical protein
LEFQLKIKLTALLLSTIFASVNQASSDIEQACVADLLGPYVQQTESIVPDSFSCVREYRSRKADLELWLGVLKDAKLKVFTPQVFSEMLKEAVEIANLGFCIYEALPQIATNINTQIQELETKIKTKNALITWKELRELIKRVESFKPLYWKEFEFNFEDKLYSAGLQPQVLRTHQSALSESQAWVGIKDKYSYAQVSWALTSEYSKRLESCKDLVAQLTTDKFNEEREDSIAAAVGVFREKLAMTQKYVVLHDVYNLGRYHCFLETDSLVWGLLRCKLYNEDIDSGLQNFGIHRDAFREHAESFGSLSEWCFLGGGEVPNYFVGADGPEPITFLRIELKNHGSSSVVAKEIREEMLPFLQTSLDETFEWLMTQ